MFYFYIENNEIKGKGICLTNLQNIEVTKEQFEQDDFTNFYKYDNGRIVINPNYEKERKKKLIDEFNTQFFNTSLGYIRRKVTMKDGSHKDFLSDLLPTISMAVNMGQTVKVIAYDMPDFDDLKPIERYQHNETVNVQFIQECFEQLSSDFA